MLKQGRRPKRHAPQDTENDTSILDVAVDMENDTRSIVDQLCSSVDMENDTRSIVDQLCSSVDKGSQSSLSTDDNNSESIFSGTTQVTSTSDRCHIEQLLYRITGKKKRDCVDEASISTAEGPSKRGATAAALVENTAAASKMPIPMSSAVVNYLLPSIANPVESSQPNSLLTSSIQFRSAYDNPESRKRWEIEKFDKVVTFIRKQLSSSQTNVDKILFEYLKYPTCYDISFLQALAAEFEVDISEVVRKKRAVHKEVVNDLVNKLINK
jgi:hypothetical protein